MLSSCMTLAEHTLAVYIDNQLYVIIFFSFSGVPGLRHLL